MLFLQIFLILLIKYANSYNFLIISPAFGYSHMNIMSKVADVLSDAGHNVTYFQPLIINDYQNVKLFKNKNIKMMNYFGDEQSSKGTSMSNLVNDLWYSKVYESDIASAFLIGRILFPAWKSMCQKIFLDKRLHEELKSQNFDVVFSETFDFCGLYFADYLKFKTIISMHTCNRMITVSPAIGEPSFINYLPSPSSKYGKSATIFDRLNDLWHHYFSFTGFVYLFDMQFEHLNQITNGGVNHWTKIMQRVSYHFVNSHPYLDFVIPTIPKVISIGGFTVNYNSILPVTEEYDEILNRRSFTIYVSFGSVAEARTMPNNYKDSILKIFELNRNVTFLWKYEDPEDEYFKNRIPENAILKKWFPQQSLLADKRVKLFITHGGLGSAMELAFVAKPAIVIPVGGDQFQNAQMLERQQVAEVYSKHEIPNWKKLNELITKMLETDRYEKKSKILSEILKNPPINPRELIVKYSEHAARFGSIETMTPFITEMGFIAKNNWDIFVTSCFFVFLSGLFLWRKCKKMFFAKKNKEKLN